MKNDECSHEAMHISVDENGKNPAIMCRYCDFWLGGFPTSLSAEIAVKVLETLRQTKPRYLASWESL